MRKVIVFAISAFISLGGAFLVWRAADIQPYADRLQVAVILSEQYYSSHAGRAIRSSFRRQQHDAIVDGGEQRLAYRFVKIDTQREQMYTVVKRLVDTEARVIVSFEQRLTDQLTPITDAFPAQRFYLFDRQDDTPRESDNVYLVSLKLDAYDYLLGYFTSLLLHYRFPGQAKAKTVVITMGEGQNDKEIRLISLGLQSVAVEHEYQHLAIPSGLNREQVFNLFETLRQDGVKAAILLNPIIETHPFFRAAAKNDIALITQAARRNLHGAQVAQREVRWQTIITTRLIPHIRYGRNRAISIDAHDNYYTIRHRARIADAEIAELVSIQFKKIMDKITLDNLDIGL